MFNAIEMNDKVLFSETLKQYVINLSKRQEFGKLKHFLINTILENENSKERRYLESIKISPKMVVQNSLGILKNLKVEPKIIHQVSTVLEYYL